MIVLSESRLQSQSKAEMRAKSLEEMRAELQERLMLRAERAAAYRELPDEQLRRAVWASIRVWDAASTKEELVGTLVELDLAIGWRREIIRHEESRLSCLKVGWVLGPND